MNAKFRLYKSLAKLGEIEFTWILNKELFGNNKRVLEVKNIEEVFYIISKVDRIKNLSKKNKKRALAQIECWFNNTTKKTFSWHLHFGEICHSNGFDIVIANHPMSDKKVLLIINLF